MEKVYKIERIKDQELIDQIEKFNSANKDELFIEHDGDPTVLTDFEVYKVFENDDEPIKVFTFGINDVIIDHVTQSYKEFISIESFINLGKFLEWFYKTYRPVYDEMIEDHIDSIKESYIGFEGDR